MEIVSEFFWNPFILACLITGAVLVVGELIEKMFECRDAREKDDR